MGFAVIPIEKRNNSHHVSVFCEVFLKKLVLVRHGQSQWNLENRFTGWVDVPLTEKGLVEARGAGELLRRQELVFDGAYTSYLQRAIHTLWQILPALDQSWIPVVKDWRLNERHYGGLQGLSKKETALKHGEDQVFQWRRSYKTPPPVAQGELYDQQKSQKRYSGVAVPAGESLEMTVQRVTSYWNSTIGPNMRQSQALLVVAHGNSLRALAMHLAGLNEEEITKFEFKTGVPLVCDLNENLKLQAMNFLG